MITRRALLGTAAASAAFGPRFVRAANAPGVTDTDIKFGQTMPYSGPASAYGVVGRTQAAYFRMINDQGGINGRKIAFLSVDDAYSPPNTFEQARRLVESEGAAFLFQTFGTVTNLAIRQYCNDNHVPQLFVATGATTFSDPSRYPWTVGYSPTYRTEAHVYGKHIISTKSDTKIAVLYQNDDAGKDYLASLKDGLGYDGAATIVGAASYEVFEPTVDSQVVALQASGADVLFIAATAKAGAQAVRKSYDLGWNATRYVSLLAASVANLKSAGLEKAKGLITATSFVDVGDPRYENLPDMTEWRSFTSKYMSPLEERDFFAAYGYGAAATIVQTLKQCGNDLSRENILLQAASLRNFHAPLTLPGVMVNTSRTNYSPIRQMQLTQFTGESWEPIGELIAD